MKKIILTALVGAFALVSCKKEEVEPVVTTDPVVAPSLVEIASATTSNNETVTLYGYSATIEAGYTKIFAKVTDAGGTAMESATVTYSPMMDMGTMVHSAPIEQPVFNATEGKYEGAVVFIMSSMAGTWTLDVSVNGNPASFTLNVAEPATQMVGVYTGSDSEPYVVSLVRPVSWHVGLNNFEIAIHHKASMMSFPADDDFTIEFEPEMVSMQHGSPNNVSPVLTSNGHYAGVVNYTMTGDWRLHFRLLKNGVEIVNDAYVDILF